MAVAFPVGIGLALVLGVIVNYVADPLATRRCSSVASPSSPRQSSRCHRLSKLPGQTRGVSSKGLVLSVACGILMGFFYRFVAASMFSDFSHPEPSKLSPYTAVFIFAVGIFLSNFVLNTLVMKEPFVGAPVSYADYLKGGFRTHLTGIFGGVIWGVGMSFNIIASGRAGFAISYGLGQGATMIAAFWGVFIWKEFRTAPPGTSRLIGLMFGCFLSGLVLIILARMS